MTPINPRDDAVTRIASAVLSAVSWTEFIGSVPMWRLRDILARHIGTLVFPAKYAR